MGKFDLLLNTLGIKPREAPVLAKAGGDETRDQLRTRMAKPKKRTVIVLTKAIPVVQAKMRLPKDMAELRHELDEAVITGNITGTDARDICHQLAAGQPLPDDLANKLVSILKVRSKVHNYGDPMKSELGKHAR